MLKAISGLFAPAAPVDDERDANGKPTVTLAKALKFGWLEVFYQPKFDLRSGAMVGAEGLIRVRHPEIGLVPPGLFLPGASDDDMIAVTEQVIAGALRDWSDCAAAGLPGLKLAVNVPADAFVRLPIAQMVRDLRPKDTRWPGLILEVTEDQVMNDLAMANEVANDLRAQSCGLAIDDFGAGYSSLARLRQLPFTELKIDRAYVIDCHIDKMNAGMLETIIEMAHRFELKTVAEGIESPHESHKLQGLGCAVGQGFLFAKPMAREDFFMKIERTTGQRRPAPKASWWGGSPAKLKTA